MPTSPSAATACTSRESADGRGPRLDTLQTRFVELLGRNLDPGERSAIPRLDTAVARKLLARLDAVPLFAHAYTHLMNFTHGGFHPVDLLDFAAQHALAGVCIHLADGEERSLGKAEDPALRHFGAKARDLGLAVHLEISTTARAEVDRAIHVARLTGAPHLRVYSRYEGLLSAVMARIRTDLQYLAGQADRHDLHIHFEQHEELKSLEIASLLADASHPRLWALFDFGNMINAAEKPMAALRNLAPWIRQAHLKGVQIVPEGPGAGHRGVLQGSAEDELPGARMLFELLMLGDAGPQVIALALEQENHYYAPMFRHHEEPPDPFIPWREMSETALPAGMDMAGFLAGEPAWAVDQIRVVRGMLSALRGLAEDRLAAGDDGIAATDPAGAARP